MFYVIHESCSDFKSFNCFVIVSKADACVYVSKCSCSKYLNITNVTMLKKKKSGSHWRPYSVNLSNLFTDKNVFPLFPFSEERFVFKTDAFLYHGNLIILLQFNLCKILALHLCEVAHKPPIPDYFIILVWDDERQL